MLRKHLEGGVLIAVRQEGFDRIAVLEVRKGNGTWSLVARLIGTRANLLLVDPSNRLASSMRRVGGAKAGSPFHAAEPAAPDLATALSEGKALSPFLQREVELRGREFVLKAVSDASPVLLSGIGAYPFPPAQLEGEPRKEFSSFSLALEKHYLRIVPEVKREQRVRQLRNRLNKALDSRRSALLGVEKGIMAAKLAGEMQMHGELILAHASRIAAGSSALETEDYDCNPIAIRLNPKRTPVENAERLFKKAKKAKASASGLAKKRVTLRVEVDDLESVLGPDVLRSSDFAGRSQAARAALVQAYGGTLESEAAVNNGLKWLVAHQLRDGHVQAFKGD